MLNQNAQEYYGNQMELQGRIGDFISGNSQSYDNALQGLMEQFTSIYEAYEL